MKSNEFGIALRKAREELGLSQREVAQHLRKTALTVHRWETKQIVPSYEDRVALLRLVAEAPRPLLADLASAGHVALDSVLPPPLPPPAALPVFHQSAPPSAPPPSIKVMDENAQTVVDDALREAAEDLDVTPRVLRSVLSRLLDRIARAGVPTDAAARMVLGVPKRDAVDRKKKPTE